MRHKKQAKLFITHMKGSAGMTWGTSAEYTYSGEMGYWGTYDGQGVKKQYLINLI